MSKEIREAIQKFAHSAVYMYSTMFAKQFPFYGIVPDKIIFNYSDYSLSAVEKKDLSRGLKYSVRQTNWTIVTFLLHLKNFHFLRLYMKMYW